MQWKPKQETTPAQNPEQSRSDIVVEAQRRQTPGRPVWNRCCATCDYLTKAGWCEQLDDEVPLDFIEKENDCEHYHEVVPF